ncbi:MAG: hypothetical protein KDJ29_15810 [Hyphomicrobiales bacterium]|nr:hypothetical protein [Hyphomicrobiales bacterium]
MKRSIAVASFLWVLASPALSAPPPISAAEKASLQAAMFQHIDSQLVRGSFLHIDFKNGAVEKLSPAKAHPMMLKMGDHFVLCTSFQRTGGKHVNVDFYVAKKQSGYSVFQTVIDDRGPLMALIKAGKVRPLK